MKKCFKCLEEKPLDEFYKHKQMADGHLNKCKTCTKNDVRQHRRENDSVREYDRQRSKLPHRKKKYAEYTIKYRTKNPEKYKAHNALNNAIRDGKITRRSECSKCGSNYSVHAHHDDYRKPLDVRWLCAKCHNRHHATF